MDEKKESAPFSEESAASEEAAPQAGNPPPKRKKGKGVLLVVGLYLLVLAAAALIIDGRHPELQLNGPAEETVEYGSRYTDPGATAFSVGRVFGTGSRPLLVQAVNPVDTGRLGAYELRYTASVLGRESSITRHVTVVDTTPPVITLQDGGAMTSWFTGYEEEGYTAADNVDGDLTDRVQRTELSDRVVYTVSDSSGNETAVERILHFSVSTPSISLNGGSDITVPAAMSFAEPGYLAADSLGNDLSEYVRVSGTVVPYVPGTYELCYSITNERGDEAIAHRRVTVAAQPRPEEVYPAQKTIYLTFDDGPGPYTARLLDTLAKYGVKATFFVTGNQQDYADMIGRAYREGHSVGVHSYTHNYDSIYASEQAFFDDFMAAEELIREQTGAYTSLFRFPGGSSNTVSRFNPGIMSRLTECMMDMGYVYFDWNVSSGDAGGTTETDQVLANVVNGCSGRSASVVLQHDIKGFSVNAVEQIILWGKRNGYAFAPLEANSPTAHHGVNN